MNKLSVIIGRFQTNTLHRGHLELISQAERMGNKVLILIGVSAATGTDKNPLDFRTRKLLFISGNHIILPVYDKPCDKDWSKQVDSIIDGLGFEDATIFGGRDNSIKDYYSGKHPIHIIDQQGNHSATRIRKEIAKEPMQCPNFKAGIIYHTQNRYPIVYSTVDVILRYRDSFLMGRKGDKFNFPGGFVDPSDKNLQEAAERELFEETGLKWSIEYHDSMKVEVKDQRYVNTKDSIMTHVFSAQYRKRTMPDPDKIQDKEFTKFKWIEASESSLDLIADCHKPIFTKFINLKN